MGEVEGATSPMLKTFFARSSLGQEGNTVWTAAEEISIRVQTCGYRAAPHLSKGAFMRREAFRKDTGIYGSNLSAMASQL